MEARRAPSLAYARIAALGVAQIVSWGTLHYAIAVLGEPMRASLQSSATVVFGAFTLALVVSGIAAPAVGRAIDRHGGGAVLQTGSLVACVALLVVATATGPVTFVTGWLLAGLAMAMTLYEAAFATLHQESRDRYRASVTALTLLGGFASTVAWPATHAIASAVGWRWTLAVFAALHLVVCLPIHWMFRRPAPRVTQGLEATESPGHSGGRRLAWLAFAFAAATFVLTALTSHLATILAARGYAMDVVVGVGILFGPAQVAARALDGVLARRVSAIRTGAVAFVLLVVASGATLALDGRRPRAVAFALALGGASGLLTIARGTVTAELVGHEGLGESLGRLSRWAVGPRAAAPFVLAALLDANRSGVLAGVVLSVVSAIAALGFARAARR